VEGRCLGRCPKRTTQHCVEVCGSLPSPLPRSPLWLVLAPQGWRARQLLCLSGNKTNYLRSGSIRGTYFRHQPHGLVKLEAFAKAERLRGSKFSQISQAVAHAFHATFCDDRLYIGTLHLLQGGRHLSGSGGGEAVDSVCPRWGHTNMTTRCRSVLRLERHFAELVVRPTC
jgi:hypothetical protein